MSFNNISKALIAAALTVLTSPVLAGEYVIQPGDSLQSIAKKTGHSVEEIVIMNEDYHWSFWGLNSGQKLTVLDPDDMRDARRWCERRIEELPPFDANATHFGHCVNSISGRMLRFTTLESSGVHYSSVLTYANAERKHKLTNKLTRKARGAPGMFLKGNYRSSDEARAHAKRIDGEVMPFWIGIQRINQSTGKPEYTVDREGYSVWASQSRRLSFDNRPIVYIETAKAPINHIFLRALSESMASGMTGVSIRAVESLDHDGHSHNDTEMTKEGGSEIDISTDFD